MFGVCVLKLWLGFAFGDVGGWFVGLFVGWFGCSSAFGVVCGVRVRYASPSSIEGCVASCWQAAILHDFG